MSEATTFGHRVWRGRQNEEQHLLSFSNNQESKMLISSTSRIAIVGGGVSGLSLARALGMMGFSRVKVFEKYGYVSSPAAIAKGSPSRGPSPTTTTASASASALTSVRHPQIRYASENHHSPVVFLGPNGMRVLEMLKLDSKVCLLMFAHCSIFYGQHLNPFCLRVRCTMLALRFSE